MKPSSNRFALKFQIYCDAVNKKLGLKVPPVHQPYMTGPNFSTPIPHYIKKAEEYAEKGEVLFKIVPDDQPQHPPQFGATLDQVTTLPYLIHESSLKERWISTLRGVPNNWGEKFIAPATDL